MRDEKLAKCQHKINETQHGFLPQKSCTTQMLNFTDSLVLSINDDVRSDVIYFDFAKAFDSVNHDTILQKLKREFSIDGTLLKILLNYLCDLKQRNIIGGTQSALKDVKSGVPQGSILGPFFLCFLLMICQRVSVKVLTSPFMLMIQTFGVEFPAGRTMKFFKMI